MNFFKKGDWGISYLFNIIDEKSADKLVESIYKESRYDGFSLDLLKLLRQYKKWGLIADYYDENKKEVLSFVLKLPKEERVNVARALEAKYEYAVALSIMESAREEQQIKRLRSKVKESGFSLDALILEIEEGTDENIAEVTDSLLGLYRSHSSGVKVYNVLKAGIKDEERLDKIVTLTIDKALKSSEIEESTLFFARATGRKEYYLKVYLSNDCFYEIIRFGLELLDKYDLTKQEASRVKAKMRKEMNANNLSCGFKRDKQERQMIYRAVQICGDDTCLKEFVYKKLGDGDVDNVKILLKEVPTLELDDNRLKKCAAACLDTYKDHLGCALYIARLMKGKLDAKPVREKIYNLLPELNPDSECLDNFMLLLKYLRKHHGLTQAEEQFHAYGLTLRIYKHLKSGNVDKANRIITSRKHMPLDSDLLKVCAQECLNGSNEPLEGALYIAQLGDFEITFEQLWKKVESLIPMFSFGKGDIQLKEGVYAFLNDPESVPCMPRGYPENLKLAQHIMQYISKHFEWSEKHETAYNFVSRAILECN